MADVSAWHAADLFGNIVWAMTGLPPERLQHRILRALNAEVRAQLKLATEIGHPGESGRAREMILTGFLERVLPPAYGLGTGFVIDACGGTSKQIDVVIYRRGAYPIFYIGGIAHYPVEAVMATIEVKAKISDTDTLKQSLENIRSVKLLDRTGGGRTKPFR